MATMITVVGAVGMGAVEQLNQVYLNIHLRYIYLYSGHVEQVTSFISLCSS